MKFDVIIGNPPYNKGIVKKIHSCYNNEVIGQTKDGHIGFYIEYLKKLSNDGVLEFVTPGRFLSGSKTYKFRKWLFDNYNVEKITFLDCKDVFPDVSVKSIVVLKISNGQTTNIEIKSRKNESFYVNPYEMPDLIVPKFDHKICFDIYKKMCSKNLFFPELVNRNVGEYSEKGRKFFNKNKSDLFEKKVLTGNKKWNNEYSYTNLTSNMDKNYRVAAKEVDATFFTLVDPDIETDHTFYTIECVDKNEGINIINYTKTNLYKMFYNSFYVSMHVSAWINYVPMVSSNFNNEKELYKFLDLTEEEINYIINYDKENT